MNNVIDFSSRKKSHDKNTKKITEIICPCSSNSFSFSWVKSAESIRLMLQCNICQQSYDITDMLSEVLDSSEQRNIW